MKFLSNATYCYCAICKMLCLFLECWWAWSRPPDKNNWKLFFLFLNQNICCLSHRDGSFEYPKHIFKLLDKKIIAFLRNLFCMIFSTIRQLFSINSSGYRSIFQSLDKVDIHLPKVNPAVSPTRLLAFPIEFLFLFSHTYINILLIINAARFEHPVAEVSP